MTQPISMNLAEFAMDDEPAYKAIARAFDTGWTLNTYNDPEEDARVNCSISWAIQTAEECGMNMVYLSK